MTADATIQPYCDRCNPKRWVHFYLNVLDAPVAIAGEYTLTFIASSACANLPAELQTRTYEVTIAPGEFNWGGFPVNDDTALKVTPKGVAFPESLNAFWLNIAGNYLAVSLGFESDPGITERLDEHTYLAFGGSSAFPVESPVSIISASFTGWIDYCVNPEMGQRYDCTPGPAITRQRCESALHQLVLRRR